MTWNYRIGKNGSDFGIYEVFYDDDNRIQGWTAESLVPTCDSAEGLREELTLMMRALDADVIDVSEAPED